LQFVRTFNLTDPYNPLSEVNRNAGIKAVKVPQEVFDLVQRAIKISELTSGAFDISYALWIKYGSLMVV
jgi:thiamine biosynthesis lipoprotein ApbE